MRTNARRVAEIKQYLLRFKSGKDYMKSGRIRKDFQEKETGDMGVTSNSPEQLST